MAYKVKKPLDIGKKKKSIKPLRKNKKIILSFSFHMSRFYPMNYSEITLDTRARNTHTSCE